MKEERQACKNESEGGREVVSTQLAMMEVLRGDRQKPLRKVVGLLKLRAKETDTRQSGSFWRYQQLE